MRFADMADGGTTASQPAERSSSALIGLVALVVLLVLVLAAWLATVFLAGFLLHLGVQAFEVGWSWSA